MKVGDILDSKGDRVVTIDIGQAVKAAADLMNAERIAALVVIERSLPVGLVSERDVVTALSEHGAAAGQIPLRKILAPHMITVSSEESIRVAMFLMTQNRVRHLPVVEDGELYGIVSLGDIVKHRLEELAMQGSVRHEFHMAAH